MNTISILGCGWLGLPLGEFLIRRGFKVKGSTTTFDKLSELKALNIELYYINLSPEINIGFDTEFFNSNILIINFPPQRRDDIFEYHTNQINSLIHEIKRSSVKYVIFISSTSVYPEVNREVSEENNLEPTKESGKALLNAENMFMNCSKFQITVLRFAGLIGYDRMPGRFLSGKRDLKNGDAPVNLIHRDDCIQIIYQIIKKKAWGEIFNACTDKHPSRRDYYTEQAKLIGLEPPVFDETVQVDFKIISNNKLKKMLKYKFKYPDPSKIMGV